MKDKIFIVAYVIKRVSEVRAPNEHIACEKVKEKFGSDNTIISYSYPKKITKEFKLPIIK